MSLPTSYCMTISWDSSSVQVCYSEVVIVSKNRTKKMNIPGKPILFIWGYDYTEYRIKGFTDSTTRPGKLVSVSDPNGIISNGQYWVIEWNVKRTPNLNIFEVSLKLLEYDSSRTYDLEES